MPGEDWLKKIDVMVSYQRVEKGNYQTMKQQWYTSWVAKIFIKRISNTFNQKYASAA